MAILLFAGAGCRSRQRGEEWARLRARFSSPPTTKSDFDVRIGALTRFADENQRTPEAADALFEVGCLRKLEEAFKSREFDRMADEVDRLLVAKQFDSAEDVLNSGSFWRPDDPELLPIREYIARVRSAAEIPAK